MYHKNFFKRSKCQAEETLSCSELFLTNRRHVDWLGYLPIY